MVLRNYVELVPGQPARLHFANHAYTSKTIRDPLLNMDKVVNTLTMQVDELNGAPASGLLSITSEKLASQLAPFLEGKRYLGFVFTITAMGEGFRRSYQVEPQARTGRTG